MISNQQATMLPASKRHLFIEMEPDWHLQSVDLDASADVNEQQQSSVCWINAFDTRVHCVACHTTHPSESKPSESMSTSPTPTPTPTPTPNAELQDKLVDSFRVETGRSQRFELRPSQRDGWLGALEAEPQHDMHQLDLPQHRLHRMEVLTSSLSTKRAASTDTTQLDHSSSAATASRRATPQWIELRCDQQQQNEWKPVAQTVFLSAFHEFALAKNLLSLDLSRDRNLMVAGSSDGDCVVCDCVDQQEQMRLTGHWSDVTTARFFPSSRVVLTGSLDFSLRIWSLDHKGKCAAVLKGHCGGVEDTAILGIGKEILSCSSDGFVVKWNCGTQQIVSQWQAQPERSAFHCLQLASGNEPTGLVLAGTESHGIAGFDLRSADQSLKLATDNCVLSLAVDASQNDHLVVSGSDDGLLLKWDLRKPSRPLDYIARNSAAIHSVYVSHDRIWTSHGDGVCCGWNKNAPLGNTEMVLTGPMFDAVHALAINQSTGVVYSACRDGQVRAYFPQKATSSHLSFVTSF